ncbi:hypothetical protein N474_07465 [Pseudoalteromonas luteoviolacea CPMOR-2]|uniref:Uncharacterized protein n=1 Tax=Pseudoalteromonas luteoviolacea DSM 6061 TaxID=1365250 RepID=A0A166X2Y6_9GAMM|nr:hypothetical protein N475_14075 [Pseudoalteromonas luteoviolacea DSM 6061]KZN57810.1 hypothetical protein N474_07465 [Pseudoalteromonas luteoviolacea CPMOR-2]
MGVEQCIWKTIDSGPFVPWFSHLYEALHINELLGAY